MISTGSALVAKNSSVRSSVARSTAVRLVSRLLLTSRRPCGRVVGSSSNACRKNASHTAARAAALRRGEREVSASSAAKKLWASAAEMPCTPVPLPYRASCSGVSAPVKPTRTAPYRAASFVSTAGAMAR
ncbi:hypothetical protein DWZ04_13250 [Faecalibacterium prausnitzii]|uniref:Uncharacterized protein n=1 Tax=Faecalibacterium prausnitzii TaxID=853 RepID=A0A3E2UEG2_9FIRM|nr:hypothetical protein C4Q21_13475 [Faecalibacterium prausnitzii]RGB94600.1 hypothetical protein DWZ04_13250 [Faecalibacterium prausnitzii]